MHRTMWSWALMALLQSPVVTSQCLMSRLRLAVTISAPLGCKVKETYTVRFSCCERDEITQAREFRTAHDKVFSNALRHF